MTGEQPDDRIEREIETVKTNLVEIQQRAHEASERLGDLLRRVRSEDET
jgi:hypothetical protein